MAIPKIIHQIYWDFSGNNKPPPAEWVEFSTLLRENNPNWEYMLWGEDCCLGLLQALYPWFLETYNGYRHPIQRADSIRPFILYTYGGVYFDMDFVCFKDVTDFFTEDAVYLLEGHSFINTFYTNSLMASPKNHPFWVCVAQEMMRSQTRYFYQTHHLYIMQSTGPALLTKCYHDYTKQKEHKQKILMIPKHIFNPCNMCKTDCKVSSEVYCRTVSAGSWHQLDTKIINVIYCNAGQCVLALCVLVILSLLIYKKIATP